jgi:hypothetical protein
MREGGVPCPSIMKRTAVAVWRCAAAVSPGMTSCSPAYRVSVVQGASNFGLMSIKTRRSACFSVTNSPALSRYGRIASYRQICGIAFGCGSGGLSFVILAQRGSTSVERRSLRSFSVLSTSLWVPLTEGIAYTLRWVAGWLSSCPF